LVFVCRVRYSVWNFMFPDLPRAVAVVDKSFRPSRKVADRTKLIFCCWVVIKSFVSLA